MHPPVTSSQLGLTGSTSAQSLSSVASNTMTEADLALRVDTFLEVAISSLDGSALRRISSLIGMGWTSTSKQLMMAPIEVEDTASIDALRWFVHEFRDLQIQCRVRFSIAEKADPGDIHKRMRRIFDNLGIPMLPSTHVKYVSEYLNKETVDAFIELRCDDLVLVYRRLKEQLSFHANRYFSGTSTGRLPNKKKLRLLLDELIFNAHLSPLPRAELSAAERQVEREEFGDATATPIHVWDALHNRVAQVRRRCGATPQQISAEKINEAYRLMTQALEKGDPLEIAAVAVILYDMDITCRVPAPSRSVRYRYRQREEPTGVRSH